jgi:RES domain-containing protein
LQVWRLTRRAYALTPFDGLGPARGGGRWNSRGPYVAYAASSRALAVLEVQVHIDRTLAPTDYVFIEATVPEDAIEVLDLSRLPSSWRAEPPPSALREIGDRWVREGRSLALTVPSVVVPEEVNVLLNPAHPRFSDVRIVGSPQPAVLDPRLLG